MNATESEALLDAWLGEGRRTLEPWQRAKVLQGYARCPIPLYLRLAAEESMFWKSYSTPDSCRLGEGISGVLDAIFNRLAGDGNHGKSMVENSLGYLAASRYGLSEDELIGLLSCNESVWSDFQRNARYEIGERRLPFVVWSRLRYDLEPYLSARATEGGLLLTLSYGQIEERWRAASRPDTANWPNTSEVFKLGSIPSEKCRISEKLLNCRFNRERARIGRRRGRLYWMEISSL